MDYTLPDGTSTDDADAYVDAWLGGTPYNATVEGWAIPDNGPARTFDAGDIRVRALAAMCEASFNRAIRILEQQQRREAGVWHTRELPFINAASAAMVKSFEAGRLAGIREAQLALANITTYGKKEAHMVDLCRDRLKGLTREDGS